MTLSPSPFQVHLFRLVNTGTQIRPCSFLMLNQNGFVGINICSTRSYKTCFKIVSLARWPTSWLLIDSMSGEALNSGLPGTKSMMGGLNSRWDHLIDCPGYARPSLRLDLTEICSNSALHSVNKLILFLKFFVYF